MTVRDMPNCFVISQARAIADLTNIGEMVPGSMTITRVNVYKDFRGLGYGSQLLRMVCEEADSYQVMLSLEINAYGPLTREELADWYVRYGFFESSDYPGIYLRMPGAPIRPVNEGYPE